MDGTEKVGDAGFKECDTVWEDVVAMTMCIRALEDL